MNDKLKTDEGSGHADETLYRQLVGSLLYLTATRPYIKFVASLLARYIIIQPRNILELLKECSCIFKAHYIMKLNTRSAKIHR